MKKERISQKSLEKMSGSKCLEKVYIRIKHDMFGDNEKHEFEVELYEGLGYAFIKHNGKMIDVIFSYPHTIFVNGEGTVLAEKIREYLGIEDEKKKIAINEIFRCYCQPKVIE